jgi:hypothetical protein
MGENILFSVAARGDEKGGYGYICLALSPGLTCLKACRFIVCISFVYYGGVHSRVTLAPPSTSKYGGEAQGRVTSGTAVTQESDVIQAPR